MARNSDCPVSFFSSPSTGTSFFCCELLNCCNISDYVKRSPSKERKEGREKKKKKEKARGGLSFYLPCTFKRPFFSASFSTRLSLMHIRKSGFRLKPLQNNCWKNHSGSTFFTILQSTLGFCFWGFVFFLSFFIYFFNGLTTFL